MSHAVMPLTHYKEMCDKVREKVNASAVKFEDTDFGYIRSAIFTAKESGEYVFTVEVKDESKISINDIFYAIPEWESDFSPGMFNVIDEKTLSAYFHKDSPTRIFISDRNGLKASDIISATLSFNGEIVANFVEPKKIKSGELADKVDEVYEAGRNDFGLKGSASGELVIINNIHPLEKTVKVNLSSADITDFSKIKVMATGKNLLNLEGRTVVNFGGWADKKRIFPEGKGIILALAGSNYYSGANATNHIYSVGNGNIFYDQQGDFYGIGLDLPLTPNTTYKFSYGAMTGGVSLMEFDAEGNFLGNQYFSPVVKTKANTAWGVLLFADVASVDISVTNPQFEIGTTATKYEPYNEASAEYTANADGTVENVKSISPVMNISTDTAGVIITAECFKDAQKEIESLTTAIALTGGN